MQQEELKYPEHEKFYKWFIDTDIYCARVIGETACYYKNGEVYALYKPWYLRDTDIKITKKEFNILIQFENNN